MNIYRQFFILLFSLFTLVLPARMAAQEPVIPDEIKPFVLPGHEVLDWKTGDLNKDRLSDAILICKNPLEDSNFDEFMPRPFLILIRQSDGKLKQVLRNDKVIMGRHDGGVFGDPFQSLGVSEGGFQFSFYGGSSWRWMYEYTFRWHPLRKQWLLNHESNGSFNSMDMEGPMKQTEIAAEELGDWPIEKFSYDGFYRESQWKVIAAKTYFYNEPRMGSPRRKGYLLRGNKVGGTRILKNFVEVSYDNGREITTGFILKKDLQLLPPKKEAR